MFSGSAREAGLRVKTVRRGRGGGALKSLRTQELLGGMGAYLTLTAELHRIQSAVLRTKQHRKSPRGEMGLAEILASIAHEINQPIAAVAMSACACRRWLQANPPNLKKAHEALKHINRDAQRAGEILTRIRCMVLGEPMRHEVVDLGELIRESGELLREKAQQHRGTLRLGNHSAGLRVRGDRVQLQQVLLNLLSNALESLDGSGDATRLVRVESRVLHEESVLISIRDSGCGLDRETAERMFEAFFSTKPGSMGLGLAICHSIIERHGGRLWATPNQKSGTTFRFSLPLQR